MWTIFCPNNCYNLKGVTYNMNILNGKKYEDRKQARY